MNSKALTWFVGLVGLAFIALAFYYWMTPADMLPHFLPGFQADMTGVHVKHGIASLVVGLLLLVYVWFRTGSHREA